MADAAKALPDEPVSIVHFHRLSPTPGPIGWWWRAACDECGWAGIDRANRVAAQMDADKHECPRES